mmetsp:Transcript_21806/g.26705  ORF Transcript_21806/g.26705 Transcript_21806/m.26705 type:complete len:572 (-) Transcript_21806:425-2140(-)
MLFLVLMITESHRYAAADSIDRGGRKFDSNGLDNVSGGDEIDVGLRGSDSTTAKTLFGTDSSSLVQGQSVTSSSSKVEAIDITSTDQRALQTIAKNMLPERRWTERNFDGSRAVIPYFITPKDFDTDEMQQIEEALQELEAQTGCLSFVKKSSETTNYIWFKRQGNVCQSSNVGTRDGTVFITLGKSCMTEGIIVHEVMHTLGFFHEHTRVDRDLFVTINFDNILPGSIRQFNIIQAADTLDSPYDYGSVMHYKATAFAKEGTTTIRPKDGAATIGQREGASEIDIKKIKLLYQCEKRFRRWDEFTSYPCTSECKCQIGDIGCGSNDDACLGSLVCPDNTCLLSTPSPTPAFPALPSGRYMIWHANDAANGLHHCIGLKNGYTTNGNDIWLYPCSLGTSAQEWEYDSKDNYIKSGIDKNKCLAPFEGSVAQGNSLAIYDCIVNDNVFLWDRYGDGSIRPRNNPDVCIQSNDGLSNDGGVDKPSLDSCLVGSNLILGKCNSGLKEFNWYNIDFCQDNPGKFAVTKPNGTVIKNRTCSWVALHSFRCDFLGATENCPVTCNHPSCFIPTDCED